MKPSGIAYLTALKKIAYNNWGVTTHKILKLFQWEDVEISEDCATDSLNSLLPLGIKFISHF
jgi:hypothetical protein